jgi:hypothetical protein
VRKSPTGHPASLRVRLKLIEFSAGQVGGTAKLIYEPTGLKGAREFVVTRRVVLTHSARPVQHATFQAPGAEHRKRICEPTQTKSLATHGRTIHWLYSPYRLVALTKRTQGGRNGRARDTLSRRILAHSFLIHHTARWRSPEPQEATSVERSSTEA